jgi:peptidoglycan/xylan/chitin deacetylase (PgdA/CDA1 family)
LSPATAELLIRHGFVYESSMMGHDHSPYQVRLGDVISSDEPMQFGRESPLVEMPISWSLDDFPHFEFFRTQGLMATAGVLQNWLDDFEYMRRNEDWGVLTYTCHPYVIGRGHRMMMLERLIQGLVERGAVFATMEQTAKEYQGRRARV